MQNTSAIYENTHTCRTQVSNASATNDHTVPCGDQIQTASANKPEKQPLAITEKKKILKNVLSYVPITGQHHYTKTSAVDRS